MGGAQWTWPISHAAMLPLDRLPTSAAALSTIRRRAQEHSFICRRSVSARARACLLSLIDAQCLLQVGMRHFNIRKNQYFCPIINLDKLWSLVGEQVRRISTATRGAYCSPQHTLPAAMRL